MVIKYIFIGAGVSSLAAANRLLSLGETNFLVLEKGTKIRKRHCPGAIGNTCHFCERGCYITEGVGGSDANFGNKLCYFPASNEITKFFGEKELINSLAFLNDLLFPYFDSDLVDRESKLSSIKEYNSVILSKSEFENMINILTEPIYSLNNLKENCEVSSIEKEENGTFRILTVKGDIFWAENLIIGSGRSSVKFLRKTFKSNNVKYEENPQDIGIRIETDRRNFSNKFYYQNDPKIKLNYSNIGSARTFCAVNQGEIVPVQFGKAFYADGIFSKTVTDNNNIALMVRSKKPLDADVLEIWCYEMNEFFSKNLSIGDKEIGEINSIETVDWIMSLVPKWPTEDHENLMRQFLTDLFVGDYKIFKEKEDLFSLNLKIYGPAIDNYIPRPLIGESLSTDIKNLFIIGDAAGVSRGYVQAMFSGVALVNSFSEKEVKKSRKWSISA